MNIDQYMECFIYNSENPPEYCEYENDTIMEWLFRRRSKYSILYNELKNIKVPENITLLLVSDEIIKKYTQVLLDIKNHIIPTPLTVEKLLYIHINVYETLGKRVLFKNNGMFTVEGLKIENEIVIRNNVLYDINGLII